MRSYDIVGYTYSADIYCPTCMVDILRNRADLVKLDVYPPGFDAEEYISRSAVALGIDYEDPYSYDSDEFPKVVFADQVEDPFEYCGRCHESLI